MYVNRFRPRVIGTDPQAEGRTSVGIVPGKVPVNSDEPVAYGPLRTMTWQRLSAMSFGVIPAGKAVARSIWPVARPVAR